MTQDELLDYYQKKLGARVLSHYKNGSALFEIRTTLYVLPAPIEGRHYANSELERIVSIWNNESEPDFIFDFNNNDITDY